MPVLGCWHRHRQGINSPLAHRAPEAGGVQLCQSHRLTCPLALSCASIAALAPDFLILSWGGGRMFTNAFLFNSRKTFSSRLSQRKGFPRVSLLWPWLHSLAPEEQVKTQRSGSPLPRCLPGKGREPSLLAGNRASSMALCVSKGKLEEGEICLNFCDSPPPLSPRHSPAGITTVSSNLFLPPFFLPPFFFSSV